MAISKNPGPVAQQLRALRRDRGWTLQDIAERSGISKATLSKLENGLTNLSFTTVTKLSEGLDLPISSLINPPGTSEGGRRSITRYGTGGMFEDADTRFEILCNDLVDLDLVFARMTIHGHQLDTKAPWRRHPGQEFIYVLSGTLILHTEAYEPLALSAGDSIVFDSTTGHKYVSQGAEHAVVLLAMKASGYTDTTEIEP